MLSPRHRLPLCPAALLAAGALAVSPCPARAVAFLQLINTNALPGTPFAAHVRLIADEPVAAAQFDIVHASDTLIGIPLPTATNASGHILEGLVPSLGTNRVVARSLTNAPLSAGLLASVPFTLPTNAAPAQPGLQLRNIVFARADGTAIPGRAAPDVTLTGLASGQTVTPPVTLAADASDADGSVASVEFFAGATSIGTDTEPPFSIDWNPATGDYLLTARAVDNDGLANTSAPLAASVANGVGTTTAGTTSAGATSAGSSSAGSTSAGSTTGAGTGDGTTAGGATAGGSGLPLIPDWSITIKKPKANKAAKFSSSKGLKGRIKGSVDQTGLPKKSGDVLVEFALVGPSNAAPPAWTPAGKISKVNKKGSVKFSGPKKFGAGLDLPSGSDVGLLTRASTNFALASSETNTTSFSIK